MEEIRSKEAMLKEVGISNSTYVGWYIAYKGLSDVERAQIPLLPKRKRNPEDIRELVFTEDDIKQLKEFRSFIRGKGKGAFRKYNQTKNKKNPPFERGWRYE